jgi:hypothetical protein
VSDLDLLRRFEPIARYSKGELDLDTLAEFGQVPLDHRMYLRFVDKPFTALELQRWQLVTRRGRFRGSGRLSRVPLHSRIADSLFDLSLAVRGRVPGGTAAAADVKVQELRQRDPRRTFYGRVVRDGGWTVLHYLFFLPMNDWRSGFNGANDHEADWEQVLVYLYGDDLGRPTPRWVACGAHDYSGDDLRRRWDDPRLTREGSHPVVFVGAGSHAMYFVMGDYVMGAEPHFLRPVKRLAASARRIWTERLGQGDPVGAAKRVSALFSVPFVDYARGDGLRIGPGQDEEWAPVIISDSRGWVHNYRGLWGLDTHDPFGGERAPAGPKYKRDGSVRRSWLDPLGWAGVDKLYPPLAVPDEARSRIREPSRLSGKGRTGACPTARHATGTARTRSQRPAL